MSKTTKFEGNMKEEMNVGTTDYQPLKALLSSSTPVSMIPYADIASENGYNRAVLNLAIEDETWFDTLDDLLYSQVEAVIAAVETKHGYTSTTTAAIVNQQVNDLFMAYAAFQNLFRNQQSKNAKDHRLNDISELYNVLPAEGWDVNDVDNSTSTSITDEDISTGIANNVWMANYIGRLANLPMPEKMASFFDSIFGKVHIIETDSSCLTEIQFWSNAVVQSGDITAPHTAFTNLMDDIELAFRTYPDLRTILTLIGFSTDYSFKKEWKRDLSGNMVPRVTDPEMMLFVSNAIYQISLDLTDSSISSTTPRRNVFFNTLMTEAEAEKVDMLTTSSNDIAIGVLLSKHTKAVSLNTKKYGTGTANWKVRIPGVLEISVDLNSTGNTVVEAFSELMNIFAQTIGNISPTSLTYEFITDVNGLSVVMDDDITEFFGYTAFNLPDSTQTFISEKVVAELVLGGDYRTVLQNKIKEMEGYVIAR